MDREGRIAASLGSALEALRLVRRELDGTGADPSRWRWVAVGLVIALQGALVAALSGYETAKDTDVTDPSNPDRVAPVGVLLRRARSAEYLNEPERVALRISELRRIEALVACRNAVMHGAGDVDLEGVARGWRGVLGVVRHALVGHPAFDPARHGLALALIADELAALERLPVDDG